MALASKNFADLITFTRASGGGRFNASGQYEWLAANVPRIDYDPVTGECMGILVEEQRTNMLLNSATLATQSLNLAERTYTMSFYGPGTVTLSGAYSGVVVGSGASTRKAFSFTATAGTLTLTVSGSCTRGQLEPGSFPTSYIPTTSAQVTRTADVAGINTLSPWFNAAEGTIIAELSSWSSLAAVPSSVCGFDDGSSNNRMYLRTLSGRAYQVVSVGGSTVVNSGLGAVSAGANVKMSGAFKENDFSGSLAGAAAIADANGEIPSVTKLNIGSRGSADFLNGHIKSLRYYPKRLTNTELQELTA